MITLRRKPQRLWARYALPALFGIMAGASWAATPHGHASPQASNLPGDGITMTGRCPNGDAFRLVSYDKQVEGLWKSFYDYQGPVGVGTVRTQTVPKVMVSRVCIALAEIASDEH
jgi:hypothetical protein